MRGGSVSGSARYTGCLRRRAKAHQDEGAGNSVAAVVRVTAEVVADARRKGGYNVSERRGRRAWKLTLASALSEQLGHGDVMLIGYRWWAGRKAPIWKLLVSIRKLKALKKTSGLRNANLI